MPEQPGGSTHLGQQPQNPGIGAAQAFAPSGFGEVGQAEEDRPGAEQAEGGGTQHVGQQGAQQIGGTGEAALALKGPEVMGLGGEIDRQARHHLGCPTIGDERGQLRHSGQLSMIG